MRFFDLHCDTAFEMYKNKVDFSFSALSVSAGSSEIFDEYCAIFAVWSDWRLSDADAYKSYGKILSHARARLRKYTSGKNARKIFFSVEDARILCGKVGRIEKMKRKGKIALVTPMWRGENILGGAYDTDLPLSKFGRSAIIKMISLGIYPDISHASRRAAQEISELCIDNSLPVIATHSNAFSVTHHPRNLTDEQFSAIVSSGGIAGVCFEPSHLSESGVASSDDVIRHIEHYMSLGGEHNVGIGSDFDGISTTPSDLRNISDITVIAEKLAILNYTDEQIDKILYSNAARIFQNKA